MVNFFSHEDESVGGAHHSFPFNLILPNSPPASATASSVSSSATSSQQQQNYFTAKTPLLPASTTNNTTSSSSSGFKFPTLPLKKNIKSSCASSTPSTPVPLLRTGLIQQQQCVSSNFNGLIGEQNHENSDHQKEQQ